MAEPKRPAPGLGELLQIGALCGVFIGIGVFAGYLLDRVAKTSPLLTFLGLAAGILGAASGSYRVIRPFVVSSAPGAKRGATDTKD